MRRIRKHLTFANVASAIALFVALGGGTAVALNGSNTVQSDDLGPGAQVKAPDVADNAVVSSDIKDGAVSVLDTRKTIPSGATITGAFRELEDDSAGGGPSDLEFGVDFYGLHAPTPLTDADINFDDTGISAQAAAGSEESSGCTGGIGIPTAPPGQVCIYLFSSSVSDNTGDANELGWGTGFNQADDKGFMISAIAGGAGSRARLAGTWAYTAP
jgi:hypothetical protein